MTEPTYDRFSPGLPGLTSRYLDEVRDEVTHCDDAHLHSWADHKGNGPLASLTVQRIIKEELSRRQQGITWAVWWVHNTYKADAHWVVKNTSTGEEQSVRPVRNAENDKKFAVETVTGYAVAECGTLDDKTLYRAAKGD